jgi:hypothetical protein
VREGVDERVLRCASRQLDISELAVRERDGPILNRSHQAAEGGAITRPRLVDQVTSIGVHALTLPFRWERPARREEG